jgi:arylsulfatase A-like enzyme
MERISRRDFLKLASLLALLEIQSRISLPRASNPRSAGATRQAGADDPPGPLPNLLILVFDTLSAHHLSLFGYQRQTTPNLARFAQRATVYHRHYAAGNFTVPGTASLLTGVYPWSHRGFHLFGTVAEGYYDRNIFSLLNADYFITAYTHNPLVMDLFDQFKAHMDLVTPMEKLAVLSESLAGHLFPNDYFASFWGERTVRGSGLGMPSSLFLSFTKIARDFDPFTPDYLMRTYADLYPAGLPNHPTGLFFLLEDTIDWIASQVLETPQPFLGYFHLLPPHEPYKPRVEFLDSFLDGWKPPLKPKLRFSQGYPQASLELNHQRYDEYIAYVDSEFGRLLDSLDRSGILNNTVFILTSDHGQLFERGIHGHVTSTLYEPLIHVPLLVSLPGQSQRDDIYAPTSNVDILPTLLHLAGRPIPDWTEGQVLPGVGENPPDYERSIYAVEAKTNPKIGPLETATISIVKERQKLVRYLGYKPGMDEVEMYDLLDDPEELHDLSKTERQPSADLKAELAARLAQVEALG